MGGVGRTRRGRGDRLVDEAFGLVLLEPLAAGTPVVAACSGGSVEIVSDERVGPLFEPYDAIGLARALADAIELPPAAPPPRVVARTPRPGNVRGSSSRYRPPTIRRASRSTRSPPRRVADPPTPSSEPAARGVDA